MLDIPSHRTTFTHEERDSIKATLGAVPGLPQAISELAGGDRRARNRLVRRLIHGLAQAPSAELTLDYARSVIESPTKTSSLGERITKTQEAPQRPGRPESF